MNYIEPAFIKIDLPRLTIGSIPVAALQYYEECRRLAIKDVEEMATMLASGVRNNSNIPKEEEKMGNDLYKGLVKAWDSQNEPSNKDKENYIIGFLLEIINRDNYRYKISSVSGASRYAHYRPLTRKELQQLLQRAPVEKIIDEVDWPNRHKIIGEDKKRPEGLYEATAKCPSIRMPCTIYGNSISNIVEDEVNEFDEEERRRAAKRPSWLKEGLRLQWVLKYGPFGNFVDIVRYKGGGEWSVVGENKKWGVMTDEFITDSAYFFRPIDDDNNKTILGLPVKEIDTSIKVVEKDKVLNTKLGTVVINKNNNEFLYGEKYFLPGEDE